MDWDRLRIFHDDAGAGSFTHAGATLNLSQSAVSRQISALEDGMSVKLFHRHARGLILTEQGEMLYRTVKDVFHELAMVEGHRGSAICGKCLAVAYADVVLGGANTAPEGYTCTMCLEVREDDGWGSPVYEESAVCRRCLKQAGAILHKDDVYVWEKPSG